MTAKLRYFIQTRIHYVAISGIECIQHHSFFQLMEIHSDATPIPYILLNRCDDMTAESLSPEMHLGQHLVSHHSLRMILEQGSGGCCVRGITVFHHRRRHSTVGRGPCPKFQHKPTDWFNKSSTSWSSRAAVKYKNNRYHTISVIKLVTQNSLILMSFICYFNCCIAVVGTPPFIHKSQPMTIHFLNGWPYTLNLMLFQWRTLQILRHSQPLVRGICIQLLHWYYSCWCCTINTKFQLLSTSYKETNYIIYFEIDRSAQSVQNESPVHQCSISKTT